jgi:hypothetical protein
MPALFSKIPKAEVRPQSGFEDLVLLAEVAFHYANPVIAGDPALVNDLALYYLNGCETCEWGIARGCQFWFELDA